MSVVGSWALAPHSPSPQGRISVSREPGSPAIVPINMELATAIWGWSVVDLSTAIDFISPAWTGR